MYEINSELSVLYLCLVTGFNFALVTNNYRVVKHVGITFSKLISTLHAANINIIEHSSYDGIHLCLNKTT